MKRRPGFLICVPCVLAVLFGPALSGCKTTLTDSRTAKAHASSPVSRQDDQHPCVGIETSQIGEFLIAEGHIARTGESPSSVEITKGLNAYARQNGFTPDSPYAPYAEVCIDIDRRLSAYRDQRPAEVEANGSTLAQTSASAEGSGRESIALEDRWATEQQPLPQDPPRVTVIRPRPIPVVPSTPIEPPVPHVPVAVGATVLVLESAECQGANEAFVLFFTARVLDVDRETTRLGVSNRYASWYDKRRAGISSSGWDCIPKLQICYSPVEFSDWRGPRTPTTTGEQLTVDLDRVIGGEPSTGRVKLSIETWIRNSCPALRI